MLSNILCGVLAFIGFGYVDATSKLQVKVIDEVSGAPIQNAKVRFYFQMGNGWKAWTESAKDNVVDAVTDTNGWCMASAITNEGKSGAAVVKAPDGYYNASCGSVRYERHSLFDVWQPDDIVLTARLQRVEHPIPMFVKQVDRSAGVNLSLGEWDGKNGELKYDLMKGDFLPPEGKGECADMTFRMRIVNTWGGTLAVSARESEMYEMALEIEFANAGDGMISVDKEDIGSGIKIRNAATNGYVRTTTKEFGNRIKGYDDRGWIIHEPYNDIDKTRCYMFRIRTKYNDRGEIVDGYYGKIYGDFDFEASGKRGLSSMRFLYYLNLVSLDTNLEWDMKTNLNNSRKGFLNAVRP